MNSIKFTLTYIKRTLLNISTCQNEAQEYHKIVDSHASILSTLKNYIVAQNKVAETEAANKAKHKNIKHVDHDVGAKTTYDETYKQDPSKTSESPSQKSDENMASEDSSPHVNQPPNQTVHHKFWKVVGNDNLEPNRFM